MDKFEGNGIFWRADQPDNQVPGRIAWDPQSGIGLDLIGAFGEIGDLVTSNDPPTRVLGVADGKEWTLENCMRSGTRIQNGLHTESWKSNVALRGVHYAPDAHVHFTGFHISLDELPAWVELPSLTTEIVQKEGVPEVDRLTVVLESREPLEFEHDGGGIALEFGWGLSGNHTTHTSIDQSCSLKISYLEPQPIERIFEDIGKIRNIVTLGSDSPAIVTSVVLESPDHLRLPPLEGPSPIDLLFHRSAPNKDDIQAPYAMFFTLDQIGGLPGLSNLMLVADSCRAAISSLLSIRYAQSMYAENRFDNAVQSAETLHRLRYPNEIEDPAVFKQKKKEILKTIPSDHRNYVASILQHGNEPRLRDRLADLTSDQPVFDWLTGDPAVWVLVVTEIRNRLTHHDNQVEAFWDGPDLYWLAESTYVLVLLALLRLSEAPPDAVDHMRQNPRIQHMVTRMREIVPRLKEGLPPWLQSDESAPNAGNG